MPRQNVELLQSKLGLQRGAGGDENFFEDRTHGEDGRPGIDPRRAVRDLTQLSPGVGAASQTVTSMPAQASNNAATKPPTPAPMMTILGGNVVMEKPLTLLSA